VKSRQKFQVEKPVHFQVLSQRGINNQDIIAEFEYLPLRNYRLTQINLKKESQQRRMFAGFFIFTLPWFYLLFSMHLSE